MNKDILIPFDKRITELKKLGFTETKVGMTNGKYSFLWHQVDTDEMTDLEFEEYISLLKKELN